VKEIEFEIFPEDNKRRMWFFSVLHTATALNTQISIQFVKAFMKFQDLTPEYKIAMHFVSLFTQVTTFCALNTTF
jgi:hypothetical protein